MDYHIGPEEAVRLRPKLISTWMAVDKAQAIKSKQDQKTAEFYNG